MNIQSLLIQLGYSQKEITVYLALIDLGASPVRSIAEKSGINRGTTYDILKSLQAQGLVSFEDKNSHQYFTPEPPDKLIEVIEQQEQSLSAVRKNIELNLPILRAVFERQGGRPLMKMYEGEDGIREILSDVLTTVEKMDERIYRVYSSAGLRKNIYEAMTNFSDKRIRKQIHVRTIALNPGGQLVGLDERKWLQIEDGVENPTYQLIYFGKIAYISLDANGEPVGVIIENFGVYETQKLIFDGLWAKL